MVSIASRPELAGNGDEAGRLEFPILDRDRFLHHPKSRKSRDLKRMVHAKASEDWVTWTAFGLLERFAPTTWWPDLVALAKADNPRLELPAGWDDIPEVRLWETVSAPRGYETASRERMRTS